jgi:hypothetical protein
VVLHQNTLGPLGVNVTKYQSTEPNFIFYQKDNQYSIHPLNNEQVYELGLKGDSVGLEVWNRCKCILGKVPVMKVELSLRSQESLPSRQIHLCPYNLQEG